MIAIDIDVSIITAIVIDGVVIPIASVIIDDIDDKNKLYLRLSIKVFFCRKFIKATRNVVITINSPNGNNESEYLKMSINELMSFISIFSYPPFYDSRYYFKYQK